MQHSARLKGGWGTRRGRSQIAGCRGVALEGLSMRGTTEWHHQVKCSQWSPFGCCSCLKEMFFSYRSPQAYTALAMSFSPHVLFSLTMFLAFMSLLWEDEHKCPFSHHPLDPGSILLEGFKPSSMHPSSLILHHSLHSAGDQPRGGKAGSDGVTSNQV